MLLTVEGLTKHQNIKPIVLDGSFTIEEQDKIALIGINGTGKSTLMKILVGEENYESGTIIKKNGLRMSYLPQDPVFEEDKNIISQILTPTTKEYEAKTILGKLGLQDTNLIMSKLSGGQRKRVALARALLLPCDLLILDEPTNHLDNEMIEWLEKYLIRFTGAVFMVTHDRYFLERICTKMIEIDRGNLYSYVANYSQYLEEKANRIEIAQANERKRQNILRKELAWVRAGVQARGTKSKERLNRFYELNDQKGLADNQAVSMDSVTSRLGKKTIEWEHLSMAYDKVLFQDFSYVLMRHDRCGIIGPNGCGKTTLLRILANEISATSGTIDYGQTVKLAFFKQGCESMEGDMKIIDYIQSTSLLIETAEGQFSASQMLERFLFDKNMHYTPISRLSGGEKRRLYLLKILMSAPNILFLDEPTNDLDLVTLQILEDYLDNFNGAIITVSHDRYFLDRICDKLFVFENQSIKQYIGGYSVYNDLLGSTSEPNIKKEKTITNTIIKMSTKEKQELETMEETLSHLEQTITDIDSQMSQLTDFKEIQALSIKRDEIEAQMEAKMERWEELTNKQQQINERTRK